MRELSILCQADRTGTEELRVIQEAITRNIPLQRVSEEDLALHRGALEGGTTLPVGSVRFVRAAFQLAGIPEPENLSYPPALARFLHREVHQRPAGSVLGHWFVKPTATKAFTGFVFDTLGDPDRLSAHDRAQYEAFLALPADAPVWVSEPVVWQSEVRYYVREGQIIGEGRYDDGPDEAPLPDTASVAQMVERFSGCVGAPCAYSLDVGVLSSGETALVEANDTWALGFYRGTLTPAHYLAMLWCRWQELIARSGRVRVS